MQYATCNFLPTRDDAIVETATFHLEEKTQLNRLASDYEVFVVIMQARNVFKLEISVCLILLIMLQSASFQMLSGRFANKKLSFLTMRDGSTASVFFNVGDKVRIIEDVWHRPKTLPHFSSKDLEGVVCGVWEKCEVDPHCCCAELAFDAPVEVQFEGSQYDENAEKWTAHFALDEIQRVIEKIGPV